METDASVLWDTGMAEPLDRLREVRYLLLRQIRCHLGKGGKHGAFNHHPVIETGD